MLDLPSSDLDVVVCGLDQMEVAMNVSPAPQKNGVNFSVSPGEDVTPDKLNPEPQMEHHHHAMPQYVPVHLNADRVIRLAAELERQPWAVLVKAIPTASVPVVKVLADPSRLPGATPPTVMGGEEWMIKQQPTTNQNVGDMPGAAPSTRGASSAAGASQGNVSPYQSAIQPPVWRGADVDNGLLKLDITFEGPEHGGIGSTEFSARVVQNVCDETGLTPENTAFVQVVMVVKELLAQRRLNEPFSGGLSSYSLLLLVLSVMCERKVIQEELDRVERQRRLVATDGGNSAVSGSSGNKSHENPSKPPKQSDQKVGPGTAVASNPAAGTKSKAKTTQAAKSEGNSARASQVTAQAPKPASRNPGETPKQAQSGNQQRGGNTPKGNPQENDRGASQRPSDCKAAKSVGNSWASIAMGQNSPAALKAASPSKKGDSQHKKAAQATKKPSSFADAVARNASAPAQERTANKTLPGTQQTSPTTPAKVSNGPPTKATKSKDAKKTNKKQAANSTKSQENSKIESQEKNTSNAENGEAPNQAKRKIDADEKTSKFNNYSSEPSDPAISSNQSVFPQGFNDVIEVLCSGETTPGKLLMHFLLFYGQHFEAHATAIDISGKHQREIPTQSSPYTHLSPYIQRRSAGAIDPITGMLTVDPIVVYDPLEGAENNNVARRCFLWSSVKWVFAQSFMTLSSAVERNTTPPGTPGPGTKDVTNGPRRTASSEANAGAKENAAWSGPYNPSDKVDIFDPSSQLLELLLSY